MTRRTGLVGVFPTSWSHGLSELPDLRPGNRGTFYPCHPPGRDPGCDPIQLSAEKRRSWRVWVPNPGEAVRMGPMKSYSREKGEVWGGRSGPPDLQRSVVNPGPTALAADLSVSGPGPAEQPHHRSARTTNLIPRPAHLRRGIDNLGFRHDVSSGSGYRNRTAATRGVAGEAMVREVGEETGLPKGDPPLPPGRRSDRRGPSSGRQGLCEDRPGPGSLPWSCPSRAGTCATAGRPGCGPPLVPAVRHGGERGWLGRAARGGSLGRCLQGETARPWAIRHPLAL